MTTADLLRAEGKARMLLHSLTVKFGPLPDSVVAQVQAATTVQLETWAEHFETATTLEDLLG